MIRTLLARVLGIQKTSIAVAAIITKGNKILLTKRSFIAESGKWCLPGGKIEYREKAESAIRREIQEELGLSVTETKLAGYHDDIVPKLFLHAVVLIFKAKVQGTLHPNFEVAEAQWFDRKNARQLTYAFTHRVILEKYWGLKR